MPSETSLPPLTQSSKVAEVKKLNRNDLEQLVPNKIVEAITMRSKSSDLAKKFELQMSTDYSKVKEKANALQKQLTDPQEVTKRIKVLEETKSVRIPKITRSMDTESAPIPVTELKRINQHSEKARVLAHKSTNPKNKKKSRPTIEQQTHIIYVSNRFKALSDKGEK